MALDVGETLVDETRIWSIWADELGIPRMTFMAAFGAVVASGGEHHDVFGVVGRPNWRERWPAVMARYGGFQAEDLYPDALPALADLRAAGYRLAIVANQPAQRTAELRALGALVDVIAMSEEMGLHKPDPRFYSRALELMGNPDPANVAYVGDRPDNDVLPSRAAGLRAGWLRRGPWGVLMSPPEGAGVLIVDSLAELVDRMDEVWAAPALSRG